MSERLWFQQSVEGLFLRGLGERLTPALRGELKRLGIDLDHLQPGYPHEVVMEGARLAARAVFPDKSEAEGLAALGGLFLDGYTQTFVGAAMLQVMKLIGTRRTLERMQRNFRTGGNYLETRFSSLGPGKAQLWMNDVSGIPDFYAGLLRRGGQVTGARNLRVDFTPPTDASCTFLVEWDE